MTVENLLIEREGAVAVLTVNRPKVLNALNTQTLDELRRAILELKHDEAVRAVILTGAGEKSFVAGADINELAVQSPTGGREHAIRGQHVFDLIEQMGKPVIAVINGYALGGGCELAMACTIRIAADTAKLGQPEINLGIIPGYAGTQRLARIVGKGRALELLLSGDQITAQEAHRLGLVNRVVPAADLMAEARKLAATLASKAPIAIRYILEAVNKGLEMPFAQAQIFEATLFGLVASTEDMREGTAAFLEKRKPAFKGKEPCEGRNSRRRRWPMRPRSGSPSSCRASTRRSRAACATPRPRR
jgi:enoyl-CoA hydratase